MQRILFLHGTGGVKKGFENICSQSLARMILEKSGPVGKEGFPFFVITPRAPVRVWSKSFDRLERLMGSLSSKFPIDSQRLYLAGQSMGANGVWEFAAANPKRFAAIAPVCGYIDKKPRRESPRVEEITSILRNQPTWVFHAANDALVDCQHSDIIVEQLRAHGNSRVKYTKYEDAPGLPGFGDRGAGHASYELAFKDPELYKWLLGYSLSNKVGQDD